MQWMTEKVSLYSSHSDNIGIGTSIRNILLSDFSRDLKTIIALRTLDKDDMDYQSKKLNLKKTLQCFTPAALLATKAKGQLTEINRTGIMQLDFDYKDICDYDIEELKRCVFSLPFIAFCGLSCSGDGFYALALIEEPCRLAEYAEHCFTVFEKYGIKADTSKGKKPENLRYVSYDGNMLIKDHPIPLHIKKFKLKKTKPAFPYIPESDKTSFEENKLICKGLMQIKEAQPGYRWQTVQKWSYTLGGLQDGSLLREIKQAILTSSNYCGLEEKYCKCAEVCFNAGVLKPIKNGENLGRACSIFGAR